MSNRQGMGRRNLLAGSAGMAALAFGVRPAHAQAAAREAPDLAKLVADGKLPPLASRLPANPLVVRPLKATGGYGGTLRRGLRGSADHNGILRMIGNQGLVRWNLEFTDILPNVAESWTVNADATEFVFKLRAGMKWSDGKPFTADDVVFSIEDCAKNTELFRSPPSTLVVDGKAGTASRIDDTHVRFRFEAPYGTFLEQLATPLGQYPTLYPKHYAGQFHSRFNPRAAELAKAANLGDWTALFRARCGDIEIPSRWSNPEKPTLDAWTIAEPYVGGAMRVTMKRNPYFWQVDTDGKQLPYIDEIAFRIFQDLESLMLDVVTGKLDLQDRHIDNMQNRPTLAQNAQRGNYRLFNLANTNSQQVQIHPNLCHKDPAMRAMLGNKDFRQALSLGIDRTEIVDLVYLGQSEPWQLGPRPEHPWYDPRLGRQFTKHDPAEANRILDRIGYAKRDAQGFRLRPDGRKVFFAIDVIPAGSDHVDALELVRRHWTAIGIDAKVNTIERALYYTRGDNNDHDMAVWIGPGGLDVILDARDYVAIHPQGSRYGLPWANWYVSAGKDGQEPPESQKRRMKLFDDARGANDPARRGTLMKELLALSADAFETIGICLAVNASGTASNRLQNVPDSIPNSWSFGNPGSALPQQFFFS
ncbi:MAG: ABC transporter substrate-binding protein [Proteobacteria bacterium]|nr:ABC transporter substrate-binding protein [Pseudomonadota bacterium]